MLLIRLALSGRPLRPGSCAKAARRRFTSEVVISVTGPPAKRGMRCVWSVPRNSSATEGFQATRFSSNQRRANCSNSTSFDGPAGRPKSPVRLPWGKWAP